MQQIFESIILLLNFIPFICKSNTHKTSKEPLWSWNCENEKCTPVMASQSPEILQSLETCNMICTPVQLWPLPTGRVSLATTVVPVRSESFQIDIVVAPTITLREHLRDAFLMFKQDLRNMEVNAHGLGGDHSVIVRLSVNNSGEPRMLFNTDESYQLSLESVTSTTMIVEITAVSFCGARHALETLSQLVWFDHYMDTLVIMHEAMINDRPKFPYRGLMIDTARNYIPFSELMRTVDAMAASKLNTLHWHASDSQAFSLQLNSVRHLAQYGINGAYTSDQVRALVRRARLRGVRVLIEIDTPAHISYTWNKSPKNNYDAFVECGSETACESPPCGQLNPFNPFVYDDLQKIYSEIIELTEVDDIFHLGGDDVSLSCWAENFNGTNPMILWLEFTRSALQRLETVNGKLPNLILFWSSRLCEYVKTDLKDLSHIMAFQFRDVAWSKQDANGLRAVISHGDIWDLNSGYGTWYSDKNRMSFNSWQRFYEYRPWVWKNDVVIEGGEATLWSWTVGEGGLHARVWPRAAAMAERLWTDKAEGPTRNVYARLDVHRTRLALRGVQSAPIWSHWCTQHPYTCN